jgi:hypothetical protein
MSQLLQPGQHLDPDQLSAFAEHALPEHERLATLAHLSECSHCRQIVFLTQQAQQQAATIQHTTPARKRWFTSAPAVSLAAASFACALIVAVSIHLHNASRSPAATTTAILNSTPPPTAEQILAPNQETREAAATPQAALEKPHPQSITVSPTPLFPVHAAKVNKVVTSNSVAKPPTPHINGVSYGALAGIANANPAPLSKDQPSQSQQQTIAAQSASLAPAHATKPLDQIAAGSTLALLPSQSGNTNETVAVTASSPQIQTQKRNAGSLFALRTTANAKRSVASPLPSNLATLTTISNGQQTLAADTAGVLFLSLDAGKHWTLVDKQWTGKPIRLDLSPQPPSPNLQRPASHESISAAAAAPAQSGISGGVVTAAPTTTPSSFQLTTDSGAVWTSPDGLIWKPR